MVLRTTASGSWFSPRSGDHGRTTAVRECLKTKKPPRIGRDGFLYVCLNFLAYAERFQRGLVDRSGLLEARVGLVSG